MLTLLQMPFKRLINNILTNTLFTANRKRNSFLAVQVGQEASPRASECLRQVDPNGQLSPSSGSSSGSECKVRQLCQLNQLLLSIGSECHVQLSLLPADSARAKRRERPVGHGSLCRAPVCNCLLRRARGPFLSSVYSLMSTLAHLSRWLQMQWPLHFKQLQQRQQQQRQQQQLPK